MQWSILQIFERWRIVGIWVDSNGTKTISERRNNVRKGKECAYRLAKSLVWLVQVVYEGKQWKKSLENKVDVWYLRALEAK